MYKIKMIILFLICVLLFGQVNAYVAEYPLIGEIVYLDAGHGGVDPGAFYENVYEKDINLEITLKLRDNLEKLGATVYLTRNDDYDLSNPNANLRKRSDLGNRAKMINDSNANLYLSIHLNSMANTKWSGAQVFYDDINEKNIDIANKFQKYFNKYLNSDRKVSEINNLYMYKNINIPGVLLELGFISNSNDRKNLLNDKYKNHIVKVISNCLIDILN